MLNIDLHMHTVISDGTDTPEEILTRVKEKRIALFSVTDHDAIQSSGMISAVLRDGDPDFLPGVEFSCKDEQGQYHILGYGYDPAAEGITRVVEMGHSYRMSKMRQRLDLLKETFGFTFSQEDVERILSLNNPGKPHIGNMMVRYGYAATKEEAITRYINQIRTPGGYVRPEEAIGGILKSGGVPVLAHPAYGSGDQLILGDEMDQRLRRLIGYGLRGIEAFYSGFAPEIRSEMLFFAEKYDLLITAGSDYHGTNKTVILGDTGLDTVSELPRGLERFLREISDKKISFKRG